MVEFEILVFFALLNEKLLNRMNRKGVAISESWEKLSRLFSSIF